MDDGSEAGADAVALGTEAHTAASVLQRSFHRNASRGRLAGKALAPQVRAPMGFSAANQQWQAPSVRLQG